MHEVSTYSGSRVVIDCKADLRPHQLLRTAQADSNHDRLVSLADVRTRFGRFLEFTPTLTSWVQAKQFDIQFRCESQFGVVVIPVRLKLAP